MVAGLWLKSAIAFGNHRQNLHRKSVQLQHIQVSGGTLKLVISHSQILSTLKAEPFRRFTEPELQSHLPAQSLPTDIQAGSLLQKAMVELYEGTEQGVIGEGSFSMKLMETLG